MRKKLGNAYEKAPVDKLKDKTMTNSFKLMSCVIGIAIVYFGGDFIVEIVNYITSVNEGYAGTEWTSESPIVFYSKITFGIAMLIFILKY